MRVERLSFMEHPCPIHKRLTLLNRTIFFISRGLKIRDVTKSFGAMTARNGCPGCSLMRTIPTEYFRAGRANYELERIPV